MLVFALSGGGVPMPLTALLGRAWLFLGVLVTALRLGGFFLVLTNAGWHPGALVGAGHPLHLGIQVTCVS